MNRIVYIGILCLLGFVIWGCNNDEESCCFEGVSQSSSQRYMDAMEHYIKKPYYYSIKAVVSDWDASENMIQRLMAPDAKCMPEILPEGEKLLLREPDKYLWELYQAYRNKRINSDDLKFLVDSVCFDSNIVFEDDGCKLQAKYKLTILYKEKVYIDRWCQMWCLFPDKERIDRIYTLEITPLSYIAPNKAYHPVTLEENESERDKDFASLVALATEGDAAAQCRLGFYYKENNDVIKAVKWFKKSARQGNYIAQVKLGLMYYYGEGISQDYAQAVDWFGKSVEQGYDKAQYYLGECYYYGRGVSQNYVQAIEWFKKSAEQGNEDAQYMLGICYYNGDVGAQDYVQAAELFKKSADQGNCIAQVTLGLMYYYGEGIPQDYVQAVELFKKSADQGNDIAQYMLGNCYYYGNGVFMNDFMAVKWYVKAAKQGNKDAKEGLIRSGITFCLVLLLGVGTWFGLNYIEKKRKKKQIEVSEEDLKTTGKFQGDNYDPSSINETKHIYISGSQTKQYLNDDNQNVYEIGDLTDIYNQAVEDYKKGNYSEAFSVFKILAENGDYYALHALGICYYWGYGVQKDIEKAVECFRKSAIQGCKEAQYELGTCYEKGFGVPTNLLEAEKWYKEASKQGYTEATAALKRLDFLIADNDMLNQAEKKYKQGLYDAAYPIFEKLAEKGDKRAQCYLGIYYYKGIGKIVQDYNKAVFWYEKAASQGEAGAQNDLGVCYLLGYGVQKDVEKAVEYFKKSAKQGYKEAQYNLGTCYEKGFGVPTNLLEAEKWYRNAYIQDYVAAKDALERLNK